MSNPYKNQVLQVYKTLYFMGREYPSGAEKFRSQLNRAFARNKNISDPKEIKTLVERANYVVKELEALYKLRKYRTMKNRYYNEETTPTPVASNSGN
jgi:1,4-alpha-glucan branching enzyme